MIKSSICSAKFVSLQKTIWIYGYRKSYQEKEEFELWLKSQIAKGCDLLKREVSEDDTTLVRYRTIVKIKNMTKMRKIHFLQIIKNGIHIIAN